MTATRRALRAGSPAGALSALLLAAVVGPTDAAIVEEVYRLPIAVHDAFDRPVAHDMVVTVVRDDARPRSPILLLNHGRSGEDAERVAMGRARFPLAAAFFAGQGYFVVVPTRIGYGETGGPDVETRGRDCEHADYDHGFATAADESRQVLDWARRRNDVDPKRIVAIGQSYGGATTLALAASNPDGLVAAINFSGGSGGDAARRPGNPCRPDRVAAAYATYGGTTHVPELWLYSANDKLWGSTIPKGWFERYAMGGAPASFVSMPPIGDNGHALFMRGGDLWRPIVMRFLKEHDATP